jgi:hypothetical protein
MEPTVWLAFLYGFGGSIAVEIALVLHTMGPRGGLKGKHKTWVFWLLRVLIALFSGVFAMAYYSPQVPLFLYVHVGAATPAVLIRLSKSSEEDTEETEPSK